VGSVKYLGGAVLLIFLWAVIFLVLVSGKENGEDGEIFIYDTGKYTYPTSADVVFTEPEPDEAEYDIQDGLIYDYTPEYEDGEVLISVADASGQTTVWKLEEYLVGTVAAEMPAKFEPEALKAQAVAARSYCYYKMAHRSAGESDGRHPEADVCGDYTHCQSYISYETGCEKYGEAAAREAFAKCR